MRERRANKRRAIFERLRIVLRHKPTPLWSVAHEILDKAELEWGQKENTDLLCNSGLDARTVNILERHLNVVTIQDLVTKPWERIESLRSIGPVSLRAIDDVRSRYFMRTKL